MYEQFTDRARKVMQLAKQQAMLLYHEYIGTEHLLLGLIAEGTGVAIHVLRNLDVDPARIRRDISNLVQPGPDVSVGGIPYTPRAKKVLECAHDEARRFKHKHIGSEHLLLGLIREEEGVAAQVLTNLGLRLEAARAEVLHLLGQSQGRPAPSASAAQEAELKSLLTAKEVETQHLPQHALAIAEEFERLIAMMHSGKEEFVANHDYERAAAVRDIQDNLRKQRAKFINQWAKNS